MRAYPLDQRGAMFGLDARLAMVIFAAISVIVGYFGYGRIQSAQNARLVKELEAMDSAVRAYQADMGTFFPFTLADSDGLKDLRVLWDKTLVKQGFQSHWNGPYVHEHTLDHKTFGRWATYYSQANRELLCNTRSNCYVWIRLTDVPTEQWTVVNQIVDEAYGQSPEGDGTAITAGIIQADSDLNPRQLYYRSAERKHK